MKFFRKKVAKRTILNDMDGLIQKASSTCDRRDDLRYYTNLREFKEDLNYVTFNKTSFRATKSLIDDLMIQDKITKGNTNSFLRRARIASHLKKGQTLPDLSQDEIYDQRLDDIENEIHQKEVTLDKLNRQKDHFLDTNNELGWTRVTGDINITTTQLNRLNNLFVAITKKKTNLVEFKTANSISEEYNRLADDPLGTIDLVEYENVLSDQLDIQNQIQQESNDMARANQLYGGEVATSFAEAKKERKNRLALDAKEVAELEKVVATKVQTKAKSKEEIR